MAHDGMAFFPTSRDRGVLVVNHEAIDSPAILFPAAPDYADPETVLKAQNAHGVSVSELELRRGSWQRVRSRYARRITANTPMELTGPAAGHPLLQTAADPTGRQRARHVQQLRQRADPVGRRTSRARRTSTATSAPRAAFTPTPLMTRYGVQRGGNPWWRGDPRFDLAVNPNEPNRFGWVVEIDPSDPESTPRKRTALGRLKHENAGFAEADDGRAVIYTGDDEVFQCLYKYVSARPWRVATQPQSARRGHAVRRPLRRRRDGRVAPARRGRGARVRLARRDPHRHPRRRRGRRGDADGPPGVGRRAPSPARRGLRHVHQQLRPHDPRRRQPAGGNRSGHILRWQNTGGDHGADTFVWSVFALAGAGLGTGDGSTIAPGDAFGSPDGLAFDNDGRLWIETDGSQPIPTNNQLLAADPLTGDIRRFLVGPKGCELTGWAMTDDQRTMFVNIQHPGEAASDPANPAAQSNWPDFRGRPRSATLAIRRADGGTIGT